MGPAARPSKQSLEYAGFGRLSAETACFEEFLTVATGNPKLEFRCYRQVHMMLAHGCVPY